MVGLDDHKGLFQPNDSVILWLLSEAEDVISQHTYQRSCKETDIEQFIHSERVESQEEEGRFRVLNHCQNPSNLAAAFIISTHYQSFREDGKDF